MKKAIYIASALLVAGMAFNSVAFAHSVRPQAVHHAKCTASGNISYMFWGDKGEDGEQLQAIAAAEKACPGLHVKAIWDQGSYDQDLTTELGSGNAPDVFQLDAGKRVPEFVTQGAVVNMAPYIKAHHINVMKTYYPECAKQAYYKGKGPYGLIRDCGNNSMLLYNKSLFEARHVALPTNNWTLNDLKNAAVKLSGTYNYNGSTELRFGIGLQTDEYRINGYMYPFGGNWITSNDKCGLTSAGSRAGLQWWNNLAYKYHGAPTSSQQGVVGDPNGSFVSQRYAMTLVGPWALNYLVKPSAYTGNKSVPFKWGVVLPPSRGNVPAPKGAPAANVHNGGVVDPALESVYSHSKHIKAAEAFVYYLTTSKPASLEGGYGIGIPGDIAVAKQGNVKAEYAPNYHTWVQGNLDGLPLRSVPKHTQYTNATVGGALQPFWQGTQSVDQATTNACNAVKSDLP